MMKNISHFLFILALMGQTAFAETVYKGTDANGNIIYSDKPFPNSKAVELAPITTYTPPPVSQGFNVPQTALEKQTEKNYQISIITPKNDETFTTDIVTIDVNVAISPPLNTNDRVKVLLNNEPYGNLTTASSMQLDHLARGAYQVQAQIVSKDEPNKPLAQSNTVTFYQQRNFLRNGN